MTRITMLRLPIMALAFAVLLAQPELTASAQQTTPAPEPTAAAPLTPIADGVQGAAQMQDAQERYGGWAWVIVAAVGAFVGMTDIVARYRDAPTRALSAPPAWLYFGVNVAASLIALKLILELNWTFERPDSQVALAQVLVAGFGALLFMRSALFPIKQDGEEKAIGPAKILEAILHASDRGVDRIQAQVRAREVAALMKDTSFERAAVELPVIALALMQNLSEDEQRILEEQVAQLRSADQEDVSNEGKCLALGLLLVEYVGNDALKAAKEAVAEPIRPIRHPKPELELERIDLPFIAPEVAAVTGD
jgi:hypothetical protein